jgi:hypothetical protein
LQPADEEPGDPLEPTELSEPSEEPTSGDEPFAGQEPSAGDAPAGLAPTAGFVHPGILLNAKQLDLVRSKVQQGAQPWKTAYDRARASEYGALGWQPKPRASVNCGSRSNPNEGCSDERRDAVAAYTHALLWYVSRDERHADTAIRILNAWAKTIKAHTLHNAPLQTGWAGSVFPLAAEIIRHTSTRWAQADIDTFAATLRRVYLPIVSAGRGGGTNGNWELIMTEATFAIAVFLDDRAAFNKAVATWRKRVPAYVYLKKDGAFPIAPNSSINTNEKIVKFWFGQRTFVDGLGQETCRDFGHTAWGIGAALAGAETAYQQGLDLYQEQSERLRAGLEFHAEYMLGKKPPAWLCGGKIANTDMPTWEIGYNHYNGRRGLALPFSQQFIEKNERKQSVPVNYFIAWETLTHAGVGSVGIAH